MKRRNFSLFLCSLFVVVSCSSQTTKISYGDVEQSEADRGKIRLVAALQELSEIKYSVELAETDPARMREENNQRIGEVLDKFKSASELATLALLTRTLSQHCGNVECFKASALRPTYENTYWKIVERLAANKEPNSELLKELKVRSQLIGTDIGDWERIVDGVPFP